VVNAVSGAALLMVVFSITMGLTAGVVLGDTGSQVGELVWAGLVQLPAILVLGGAVVAIAGLLPRWTAPVVWNLLVASLVVGPMFGPALRLPQRVQALSPFTHSPKVPVDTVTAGPVLALLAVGLGLLLLGVVGLRHRSLVLPA
jgi:ABC-2 type transport system permease protein